MKRYRDRTVHSNKYVPLETCNASSRPLGITIVRLIRVRWSNEGGSFTLTTRSHQTKLIDLGLYSVCFDNRFDTHALLMF